MLLKPSKNIHGELALTPKNFYFTFQQYLVTWINIITKERALYPPESYEHRNSFNLRVPFTRHPKVKEWQDGLVSDLMDDLVFKNVRQIKLIIYNELTGHVAESYCLNISEFLHVSKDYYDKEIRDLKTDWTAVYDEFRGNLYTLLTEIRKLPALNVETAETSTPVDRSWKFNVVLETTNVSMNTNWVLDKEKKATPESRDGDALDMDSEGNGECADGEVEVVPLQIVDTGPIVFYSSIELKHP